jgi:membrane-bound lytic murein transglycosylase D
VTLDFLRFYLVANALLALAALMMVLARALNSRLRRPMSYRAQLYLAYGLIFAAMVGSLLPPPSGGAELLPAMTQVWAAPSMHAVTVSANALDGVTISAGTSGTSFPLETVARAIGLVCLIGIAVGVSRTLVGAGSVRRVLGRAQLIRASGSLRIVSSDDADVPFSCWLPGACYIVVPSALILRPRDLAIALRHETQHHRQGDTRAVYVTELLRGVFLLNPLLPVLLRQLRGLQEFACDEALVHRIEPREYCECLIRVARSAIRSPGPLSCLRMAGPEGDSMLSRRIGALLRERGERLACWKVITLNIIAIVALVATGVGLSGSVQDKRVSRSQALEMAAIARARSSFPIIVNEQVLTELNRFLGTPDGRAFLRDGLRRMGDHEELISARLTQHGLPRELLAVPLVESGYRNLEQSANPRHGAGIWMFIKPTARRFGLTVETGFDERLNVASETDAAMRMLSGLHDEFGDWNFALLAYNSGSERIRRAVRDGGDRPDAFQAAEQGYENDPGYLARVTAAVIVLKNTNRLRLAATP